MAAVSFSVPGVKDVFQQFNQCEGCQKPLIERVKATCGHFFHPDCLIPWLEKNSTCPMCRQGIQKLTLPQQGELLPALASKEAADCPICLESLNARSVDQVFTDVFYRTDTGKNYHSACFQTTFGPIPSDALKYREISTDLLLKEQGEEIFWEKVAVAVVVLACLVGIISTIGFVAFLHIVLQVISPFVGIFLFFMIGAYLMD